MKEKSEKVRNRVETVRGSALQFLHEMTENKNIISNTSGRSITSPRSQRKGKKQKNKFKRMFSPRNKNKTRKNTGTPKFVYPNTVDTSDIAAEDSKESKESKANTPRKPLTLAELSLAYSITRRQNASVKIHNSNINETMENMLDTLINLISKRKPISDVLIMTCWYYELEKNKKNKLFDPLNTRVWTAINSSDDKVLKLPLNKKEFNWFQLYLLDSIIWLEPCFENDQIKDMHKIYGQIDVQEKSNDTTNATDNNSVSSPHSDTIGHKFLDVPNRFPCTCGDEFELVQDVAFDVRGSAICDKCRQSMSVYEYTYHCPTHPSAHNNGEVGWGFCLPCARQEIDRQEREKTEKANDRSSIIGGGAGLFSMSLELVHQIAPKKSAILYDHLMVKCHSMLNVQKEFLKEKIDAIVDTDGWKEMIGFPELLIVSDEIGIRQDSCVDKLNDRELIKYSNKSKFSEKELKVLGLKNMYESNVYLTEMILKAHLINEQFHFVMQDNILKQWKDKFFYRAGPVKRIERAQRKSESDYAGNQFPSAAHVVDMVRGSVCWDDCDTLLQGLKDVIKNINKGDTCLKRVIRIKNMFSSNKAEFGVTNNNWLYCYGDIKLNILMEYKRISMIVECQFLLSFMAQAKTLGHGLYELERNYEFMKDMSNLNEITSNKQQQLYFIVHYGDSKDNQHALSRLLCCYGNEIDITATDSFGMSAIHYVSKFGYHKLAEILFLHLKDNKEIKRCLNMKTKDLYGYCPIHLICQNKNLKMLKKLVEFGKELIDFTIKDESGFGSFFTCLFFDNLEIAKYFLSINGKYGFNIDLNESDHYGNNLLHIGTLINNVDIMSKLFDLAQNEPKIINKANDRGNTPLVLAVYWRWEGEELEDEQDRNKKNLLENRKQEAEDANFECFRLFLSQSNIDVNARDESGLTPLMGCLELGKEKFANYLVKNNKNKQFGYSIDFSQKDTSGANILHYAALSSNAYVMKQAMDSTKNINVNQQVDDLKFSPIFLTICENHADDGEDLDDAKEKEKTRISSLECFKLLLSHKNISINVQSVHGMDVFLYAIACGDFECVQYMLDNNKKLGLKIKLETVDSNKHGALFYAALRGYDRIFKLLVDTGKFDVNKPTAQGDTPLVLSVQEPKDSYFNIFKLLLSQPDIDVNYIDDLGTVKFTPLAWCFINKNTKFIEYFISNNGTTYNIDFGIEDQNGSNGLHHAARTSNVKAVAAALKQNNLDVNKTNKHGNVALTFCIGKEKIKDNLNAFECFKLLVNHPDIDVNKKDSQGMDTLLRCVAFEQHEYVEYMIHNCNKFDWNIDFNASDPINANSIFYTALNGDAKMLELLLNTNKCDINAVTSDGRNALLRCCTRLKPNMRNKNGSYFDCFKLLLSQTGINVNTIQKDKDGKIVTSTLIECLMNRDESFIDYLIDNENILDYSIDFSIVTESNANVLFFAATRGHVKTIKRILKERKKSSIDINMQESEFGFTPLFASVERKGLLEADSDISGAPKQSTESKTSTKDSNPKQEEKDDKDESQQEELLQTELKHSASHVSFMLNNKQDQDVDSKQENNNSRFECFKLLLNETDIRVDIKHTANMDIFLYCVAVGNYECVKYLIDNDGKFGWTIDINTTDINLEIDTAHPKNSSTQSKMDSGLDVGKNALYYAHCEDLKTFLQYC